MEVVFLYCREPRQRRWHAWHRQRRHWQWIHAETTAVFCTESAAVLSTWPLAVLDIEPLAVLRDAESAAVLSTDPLAVFSTETSAVLSTTGFPTVIRSRNRGTCNSKQGQGYI